MNCSWWFALHVFRLFPLHYALAVLGPLNSYLSAVTEKITGREQDTCPDDPRRNEEGYSTGSAKKDMGNSRMDILRSEIACERRKVAALSIERCKSPGIGN